MADELPKGLRRDNKGRWRWERWRNGKPLTATLGNGGDPPIELVAECNRLFDDGATPDEIRQRVADLKKSPPAGLTRDTGGWKWKRERNSKHFRAILGNGDDPPIELAAECNRLFDEGATQDEIRQRVVELRATAAVNLDHLKPPAEAQPLVDLGMSWVKGATEQ